MPSVILVGPCDSDKTALADAFKQTRAGKSHVTITDLVRRVSSERPRLRDESMFWDLQKAVAQRQCDDEESFEGRDFISTHSLVDAVVGTNLWKNSFVEPKKQLDSLLGPDAASKALHRYRRSLTVLVHPSYSGSDDEVGGAQLEKYTDIASRMLSLLGCAFLDLREMEFPARVEALTSAVKGASGPTLPSPLANLDYFEKLSSKKPNEKAAVKRYFQDFFQALNFPFYLKHDPSRFELPCLFLSQAELRLTIDTTDPGKTNRFLHNRTSSEGVFLLQFSREVPPDVVCNILGGEGVRIQGEVYNFLGCSSSGLKDRKCWLLKGTRNDAHQAREDCGDFASLTPVSKQMARFSLLLSNVVLTSVCPSNVKREPDVNHPNGSNFTDGCGSISADLADKLFCQVKRERDKSIVIPSVFQIRQQGNKGVLTKNSDLEPKSIVIRDSMVKFKTDKFPQICVCDFSRPHAYGHLNRQFILLLSGLGVPDKVLEELQRQHFERLRKMLHDRDAALMVLEWQNRTDEFVDYLEGCGEEDDITFNHLQKVQKRLIGESHKLRILVPESRTLFGVAEPPRFDNAGEKPKGILKPGECLVRITMRGMQQPYSLSGQQVIVSKNPCYLLGDIRVLKAVSSVDRPELRLIERDLVDCIVFPIEGDRPHSEEIAGSDLDGDQYFVCWQESLIPPKTIPAYTYPAYSGRPSSQTGSKIDSLVEYFSIQNKASAMTARVDTLFRSWADVKGVTCSECERLGMLFSRAVDSAKSGERVDIAPALQIKKEERPVPSPESRFVWQRMEHAAQQFILEPNAISGHRMDSPESVDEGDEEAEEEDDFLLSLVQRNHLSMSEFTKFRLVMHYLGSDIDLFFRSIFARHVNFALFSPEERGFAVEKFDVPPYILENALRCYSRIVGCSPEFLKKFADGAVPWNFYWRSDQSEKLRFPDFLAHACRTNTDVLLIVELSDAVSILLRFSRGKMRRNKEDSLLKDDNIRNGCNNMKITGFLDVQSVFISRYFGYVERYSLTDNTYKMNLSEDGLQIFRGKPQNTFVHLKVIREDEANSTEKKARTAAPTAECILASVDLTRFNTQIYLGNLRHPLVRKTPVHSMEMFVCNRRSNYSEVLDRRIAYFDILVDNCNDWSRAVCYDRDTALPDEDSISDFIPDGQDIWECLCIDFASTDELLRNPKKAVLSFISSVLYPAFQRYGVGEFVPQNLQAGIASAARQLLIQIMPKVETEDFASLVVAILALATGLDIDIIDAIPPQRQATTEDEAENHLQVLIELVGHWDIWLVLSTSERRRVVLSWLENGINETLLNGPQAFVNRNICEQACVLLSEMEEGSVEFKSSTSVSRLVNLRLDPSQSPSNETMPVVTLYCVKAIPTGVRFAVGEYVCLLRQDAGARDSNTSATGMTPKVGSGPVDANELSAEQYDTQFPPLGTDGSAKHAPNAGMCGDFVPKKRGICLGRVESLCEAPFSISIRLKAFTFAQNETPELLKQCLAQKCSVYWELQMVPANVVVHVRNVDAIQAFLDPVKNENLFVDPEILPYLVPNPCAGPVVTEANPIILQGEASLTQDINGLNPRQQEAINCAFRNRVSLVHGPPGTGKTTTAVQIMIEILSKTQHRVLVCAETNLAVDNLASRFLRDCNLAHHAIRVGSNEKVDPELEHITLERLVRKRVTLKRGQHFYLTRYKKIISEVFLESRIVFTTCAGAGDPLLNMQTFDSVLMDEASMTTEPGALCPIAHGCRHLVLIGDHKQLGPHANGGNCVSLFERLTQPRQHLQPVVTMLNEQHRMHPDLCDFPSRTFYDGRLLTASGIQAQRPVPRAVFGGRSPIRFVNVTGGREKRLGSGSWFNEVEVQRVVEIVEELLKAPPDLKGRSDKAPLLARQITVLTLYRAQQMKIRERFSSWHSSSPPEVCSVDGFQGRENDVIVVSTVRCGSALGFCDDERRVNVLLTRARRGLVIIGNRETLSLSALWSNWLQEAAAS